MFQGRAILRAVCPGLHIAHGQCKGHIFRGEALRGIADHEAHEAGDAVRRSGARKVERRYPVDLFLEELEVHHEVGVVGDDGGAFPESTDRVCAGGQGGFDVGGQRTIRAVEELAVDVPTRVHRGVQDQVRLAGFRTFVQRKLPFYRVVDLGREGARHGEQEHRKDVAHVHDLRR